jgi:type III pantothenate kinase
VRLPRVELVPPDCALGRNTVSSMQSGIVWGYVGMVKELVSRCAPEVPLGNSDRALNIVATGGLAELIAPHVPAIQHIEPHLTLEGLRLIWEAAQ